VPEAGIPAGRTCKKVVKRMQPGDEITVYKLDTRGAVVVSYQAILRELLPSGVCLSARWTRPTLELGYTVFETGDRFREWFYTDRWYNIFAVASERGELKGWYCNVAEPAHITPHSLSSRDLLLDLWVDTSYAMTVLDEEEFDSDQSLTPDMRASALEALDQLRATTQRRESPFDLHQRLW
jgi:hypothetical protein